MKLPNYFKVSTPNNADINLEPIFNDDVVEVVRCEKCKHYDYERDVCHNPRFGDGHANYPPPCVREDFYCADGKWKEK